MRRHLPMMMLQGICLATIAVVASAEKSAPKSEVTKRTTLIEQTFDAQEFPGWSVNPSGNVRGVKGELVSVEGSEPQRRAARLGFAFAINDQDKVIPDTWQLVSSKFAGNAKPPANAPVSVVFRARTSQPGRSVRVMIHDSHGETFATGPKRLTAEWQTVVLSLDDESVRHWGGDPGDEKIDWPLRLLAVEVIHWGGVSSDGREHLWIEDLQVVYERPQE